MTNPAMFTSLSRRAALAAVAGAATIGFASRRAVAQGAPKVTPDALYAPGPLGDKILGRADAPVTIVEYASLTCSHCAHFRTTARDHLIKTYVDTGKARLIFRDFPLDNLALAAAMLTRCTTDARYEPLVDVLFSQQKTWAYSEKPVDALLGIARQAGFTQESFDACLSNQKVLDGILAVRKTAAEKFGVNSTPSFFFNGAIERGALTPAQIDAAMKPLLGQ